MSNMSYCRFHNTYHDFLDCASVLEEMADGEGHPLSEDELDAAVAMLTRMEEIMTMLNEKRENRELDTMRELLESLNDNLKEGR
ncbi:MAG TPA: hypothetical protein VN039_07840 [Nitrospira sp.]|nr:hypothetical protein [Nitrospira sp.]